MTALFAALPGFIDLLSIGEAKLKRIGIIHMVINLVIVALYVVNLLLRHGGSGDLTTLILSAAGIVLLSIAGWLGGELVHHYGVSVTDSSRAGRTEVT